MASGCAHLAPQLCQFWQRVENQVWSLLVVQAPHEAQQRRAGVDWQPQLPLQRALAGGLAC